MTTSPESAPARGWPAPPSDPADGPVGARPTSWPPPRPEVGAAVLADVAGVDARLPADFVWGVATASHQVEGAVADDGRTPSIWDTFAARPGAVANGDTAAVAVDHYHRLEADLDLLGWLGVDAYRFSVSWSRIVPDDSGRVNQRGLDFYRRLVSGLHERGIMPSLTLYHWDLPQWLQDRGGWTARATVDAFVDYATTVAEALDGVSMWATHNEPWCAAFLGHMAGVHAPGIRDAGAAVAACHHLLLSHGRAVGALRDVAGDGAEVGIVLNLAPVRTSGDTAADHEAVRRVDGGRNRAWLGPLFDAAYPDDVLADWEPIADLSVIRDGDLDEIATPMDWLGINYYNPVLVAAGDGASPEPGATGVVSVDVDGPTTAMGWPIEPAGLGTLVRRVAEEWTDLPLWITENGAAMPDVDLVQVDGDGTTVVADLDRVDYLRGHIREVARLVAEGHDIRGYFVWSLLDNFEWAEGYRHRFGVVHVDYDTLARTPKASAHWFREVIGRRTTDPARRTSSPSA